MSNQEDQPKKPTQPSDEHSLDEALNDVSGAGDYGLSASETEWKSSVGWRK